MEQLVFKPQESELQRVDAFVSAMCSDYHLDNYYAIVSCPIMQVMSRLVVECSNPQTDVVLSFGYSRKGLAVEVSCADSSFMWLKNDGRNSCGVRELIDSLVDEVTFNDDMTTLKMVFRIRGIDHREHTRRVAILDSRAKKILTKQYVEVG